MWNNMIFTISSNSRNCLVFYAMRVHEFASLDLSATVTATFAFVHCNEFPFRFILTIKSLNKTSKWETSFDTQVIHIYYMAR